MHGWTDGALDFPGGREVLVARSDRRRDDEGKVQPDLAREDDAGDAVDAELAAEIHLLLELSLDAGVPAGARAA